MRCLILLLASIAAAVAQPIPSPTAFIKGSPPGGIGAACSSAPMIGYLDASGNAITCVSSVWTVTGGGGGSIPHTTNVLKGDGSGGAADSGNVLAAPQVGAKFAVQEGSATVTNSDYTPVATVLTNSNDSLNILNTGYSTNVDNGLNIYQSALGKIFMDVQDGNQSIQIDPVAQTYTFSGGAATVFHTTRTVMGSLVAFSALPTCNSTTDGSIAAVSDSTTKIWGATITGGGTNHVSAYCNGTSWTVGGSGTALASTNLTDSSVLVRTSDTGSVTNAMLAGSIANAKLSNPATTVNSQTCTLGSSCTVPLSANNAQTSTYQAVAADFSNYKHITVASGTFTITLVANTSQPAAGQYIEVVNYGSGTVTIARSGQNINGTTNSISLGPVGTGTGSPAFGVPQTAHIESDGSNYFAWTVGLASSVGVGTNSTAQFWGIQYSRQNDHFFTLLGNSANFASFADSSGCSAGNGSGGTFGIGTGTSCPVGAFEVNGGTQPFGQTPSPIKAVASGGTQSAGNSSVSGGNGGDAIWQAGAGMSFTGGTGSTGGNGGAAKLTAGNGGFGNGSGTNGNGGNVLLTPGSAGTGGSGTGGTNGLVQLNLKQVFSKLPACASGTEGSLAPVTDSTTTTWGATITGSGSSHVLAYCDGTNWTVAAM